MLIRVAAFDLGDEDIIMEFKKQLPVAGALEYQDEYYIFYPEDVYDEITNEGQKTVDELAKLMRREGNCHSATPLFWPEFQFLTFLFHFVYSD